jgi:hypothetical protein
VFSISVRGSCLSIIWPGYSSDTFAFRGDSRLVLIKLPVYSLRSFIIRPKLGAFSCISLGVHRTLYAPELVSGYAKVVKFPLLKVSFVLPHSILRERWEGLHPAMLVEGHIL